MRIKKPKNHILNPLFQFLAVTFGAVLFAINLCSFVPAGGLYPSGFSGIAILIQRVCAKFFALDIPFTALYIPINLIPIYIGFKYIGKRFTLYSLYVITLTSILTDTIPKFMITDDMLLISVFGGILNGLAVVVTLLAGASGGGMDFISIFMSERKGKDAWNLILLTNSVILLTAGFLFGFEKALYSIIFQYCNTQIIKFFYKRYQKHTLLIITDKTQEIYEQIRIVTHHDATLFVGTGCYEGAERKMLYSVVSSDQVSTVINIIKEIDPKAFINSLKTEELSGRFYKQKKR